MIKTNLFKVTMWQWQELVCLKIRTINSSTKHWHYRSSLTLWNLKSLKDIGKLTVLLLINKKRVAKYKWRAATTCKTASRIINQPVNGPILRKDWVRDLCLLLSRRRENGERCLYDKNWNTGRQCHGRRAKKRLKDPALIDWLSLQFQY